MGAVVRVVFAFVAVGLVAPAADARTVRVRWSQNAFLTERTEDQIGFVPIKTIQPDLRKPRTVRSGSTTYKVTWINSLIGRRTTSTALREARRDATSVPTSYYGTFTDRALTAKEKRSFDVMVDLARDADVLVVNRGNPVCASGLTLAQARAIAGGDITRWSQVTTVAPGMADAIVLRASGFDRQAQPRFGMKPVQDNGVVTPDGGLLDAYNSNAVAAVTAWSRARAYSSVCAVPIDGVTPTDATVFDGSYGPAYPIQLAMPHRRGRNPQIHAMVAAYVEFLKSDVAAAAFRRLGVMLTADGPAPPAAAAAGYRNFDCVFQGGPEYTWLTPSGERWKSTTYFLEGFGTTCGFATKWVRRLATEPYSGGTTPKRRTKALKHGPPGWRCQSTFIPPPLDPQTAYHGNCQNQRNKNRVFQWESQSGYDDGPVATPTPTPEE